ncbi:MAG TPA: hypothetical protein PK752_05995 [Accumulibacter sp.]|uniref:hypothetical protein n=1 Tax=Accumulibacter sp. TaxID=2053492 RepID=UPI002BC86533|nr:hypothetical protein [Accumulibacter sp.]HRD87801.1 hypothetical protein [Accumulibacter sp.]
MPATTGQIRGKAHKLCEWLCADDTELLPQVSSVGLSRHIASATKWHIGRDDELVGGINREVIDSMPLRLPAKQMFIEADLGALKGDRIGTMTAFALCFDLGNESIRGFFFGQRADEFCFMGGGMLRLENGRRGISVYCRIGKEAEEDFKYLQRGFSIVETVLVALNCTNVRSVDYEPPVAINKKRQKAGKPPIFTYKTLHILAGERSASHDKRADDAEAKRSPRLHFRRGHFRRISGDRMTWVQPCMVGDQRLGMVQKAYALKHR